MWQDATFSTLTGRFLEIVELLVLVIFALTLLVATWKIISVWIIHAADEKKREEGRNAILIIFIVLFLMASVWGIVALLGGGLGLIESGP